MKAGRLLAVAVAVVFMATGSYCWASMYYQDRRDGGVIPKTNDNNIRTAEDIVEDTLNGVIDDLGEIVQAEDNEAEQDNAGGMVFVGEPVIGDLEVEQTTEGSKNKEKFIIEYPSGAMCVVETGNARLHNDWTGNYRHIERGNSGVQVNYTYSSKDISIDMTQSVETELITADSGEQYKEVRITEYTPIEYADLDNIYYDKTKARILIEPVTCMPVDVAVDTGVAEHIDMRYDVGNNELKQVLTNVTPFVTGAPQQKFILGNLLDENTTIYKNKDGTEISAEEKRYKLTGYQCDPPVTGRPLDIYDIYLISFSQVECLSLVYVDGYPVEVRLYHKEGANTERFENKGKSYNSQERYLTIIKISPPLIKYSFSSY